MRELDYSRDLRAIVEKRDSITADEAIQLLKDVLLGEDWYITDPVGKEQAIYMITKEILRWYAPKKRRSDS